MRKVVISLNILAQEMGHTLFWVGVGFVVAELMRWVGWL